jgi:hypothetical protein
MDTATHRTATPTHRTEPTTSRGSRLTPWLIAASLAALFTLGAWAIVLSFEIGEPTWVGLLVTFAVLTLALGLVFVRLKRGREARAVER